MTSRTFALRTSGVLATTCLAFALLSSSASANLIEVTTTADSGPGSLRQAIADAAPGDVIGVPEGDFVLTSGRIPLDKSLTIKGAGAAQTTISGNDASQVFALKEREDQIDQHEVEISGVTIRDGKADRGGCGAIEYVGESHLTLREVVLTENFSEGGSGALCFGADRLTIADSEIVHNRSRVSDTHPVIGGGAVVAAGTSIIIERSTIADNIAEAIGEGAFNGGGEIYGAGLLAEPGTVEGEGQEVGQMLIVDSTFSDNRGVAPHGLVQGGGILIIAQGANSETLLRDTIVGNQVVTGNHGIAQGGGLAMISVFASSSLAVTSSTISSNSARGSVSVGNGGNVFKGNFLQLIGSHRFDGDAHMTFADTIVSNGFGGAGTQNCMVEENPENPGAPFVSLGFNLDSLNQCGFNAAGDILNRDPLLGPLAANGGPTATLLPALNSPVVDQGASFGSATDQRGLPRPFDFASIPNSAATGADGSDIGAVELQANGK
jgi:hypothetical protein